MNSSLVSASGRHVGFCPRFSKAMDFIGRRWTGAIIRTLISGPCRFNELLARVSGVSDRILSERLRELESLGIVKREVVSGPPIKVSYGLTCSGYELEPIITVIEAWAGKWIVLETPATDLSANQYGDGDGGRQNSE